LNKSEIDIKPISFTFEPPLAPPYRGGIPPLLGGGARRAVGVVKI